MIGSSRVGVESRNLTRFLHHLAYPLLTGFLFDLSLINQVIISSSLVLSVAIVGDFVEALLVLWQAIAVAGFVYMLISQTSGSTVRSLYAASLVLFLWILLLSYSRYVRITDFDKDQNLIAELLTTISFIYIGINAPRGGIESLSFISHEDNSKQLIAPMEAARTGRIAFDALSLGDRESVGYFSKFVANFTLNLGVGSSDASALKAIQAISNAWVLVLLSFLVIGIQFYRSFLKLMNIDYGNLFLCLGFVLLFRSFYVEHLHGFLPLFLLGLVGLVFIYTFRRYERESVIQILIHTGIGSSLGFSMTGSWQPWAPVGLAAVVLVFYKAIGRQKLRSLLLPSIVIPAIAVFVLVLIKKLPGMIQGADLESGGPAYVDSEVLIIFGMSLFALIFISIQSHFVSERNHVRDVSLSNRIVNNLFIIFTFVALSTILILNTSQNQNFTICLLVMFGYFVLNRPSQFVAERHTGSFLDEISDLPLIFCVISFIYIVLIYLASRYVGPNYFASYASHKSSTVFLAQFSWLPILAIGCLGRKDFRSMLSKLMVSICLLLLFSFNSSLRTNNDSEWILLKYQPKSHHWWHTPIVKALRTDDEQILLCSNNDLTANDYQTYVCNRFLHSLFAVEVQGEFRYQQTSMSGPRPEDLSRVRKYLEDHDLGPSTTVFSKDPLSAEMRSLFSSQRVENIHYVSGF